MLSIKPFLQPCNSTAFTPFSPYLITSTPLIPNKPHKPNSSIFFTQGRNGVVLVSAVKKQKRGGQSLVDFDDEEEDGEEEEGMFIPLSGMKEWLEKKPIGFGQGKEYDTSLEDKLLEELEQSRKAQIVNINKLKANPSLGSSKKEQPVTKASEPVPNGVCVRVGNLPKKKNIQRDLQLVFKGFPAIVNISPAVSGNKKTRDPICQGFAFVNLGSVEAANRFVQTYSRKSITFGKISKLITCEITDPTKSSGPASKHLSYKPTPGKRLPIMDSDSNADSDVNGFSLEVTPSDESGVQGQQFLSATLETLKEGIALVNLSDANGSSLELREVTFSDESGVHGQQFVSVALETLEEGIALVNLSDANGSSLDSREVTSSDESGVHGQQFLSAPLETLEEGIAIVNLSETNDNDNTKPSTADRIDSSRLKQQQKRPTLKKKQTVKGKSDKSPKLNIPGSTKRLRVKEKAVLAGAFSKYGSKVSSTVTKER